MGLQLSLWGTRAFIIAQNLRMCATRRQRAALILRGVCGAFATPTARLRSCALCLGRRRRGAFCRYNPGTCRVVDTANIGSRHELSPCSRHYDTRHLTSCDVTLNNIMS